MVEKKIRLLCLLDLLNRETDEQHPMTIAEILRQLEKIGITANWKTVKNDLVQLEDSEGVDLICNKGRELEYFIGNRHFEMPELKLLVDAVLASRFISHKKSKALIDKLTDFTSRHQTNQLNRNLHIEKHAKTDNERVLYAVDMLNTAINAKQKVAFKYYEYDSRKKKVYKHNRIYIFSPYGLVWNSDCYYVIGYSESHDKIIKFRVDRIAAPKLPEEAAKPIPSDFDISVYTKNIFNMFDDSPLRDVSLKCENVLMKNVIDRFGEDVEADVLDTEHFIARVKVSASPAFYGWVFGFAGKMEITAPADIRKAYADQIRFVSSKSL